MKTIKRVQSLAKYYETQSCWRKYRYKQMALATPAWANDKKITTYYRLSSALSKATGVKYVVDHIVPVHHEEVCGLHCEDNLRVVPEYLNQIKSNKYWPGDWSDCQLKLDLQWR